MQYLFIGGVANGQRRSVEKTQVSIPRLLKPRFISPTDAETKSFYNCDDYSLRSFTNTETQQKIELMVLTSLTDQEVIDVLNHRKDIAELTRMDTDDMLPVRRATL